MESEQSNTNQNSATESTANSIHQKPWFKWLIGSVLLTLFVLFGFSRLTAYLAGNIIENQVSNQTNDTYQIHFDNIRIKWTESLVVLKNTSYQRTDKALPEDVYTSFGFDVDHVEVKLQSILDIYFEHAINVKHVKITEPNLRVLNNKQDSNSQSFSLETGDLYLVLQGFVKSFRIDHLQVNRMKLEYAKQNNTGGSKFKMNDVSFKITNFKLDSTAISKNEELFFTESFDLTIKDQWINLSDQTHQIHFDSLKLSTSENNIELFNILLDTGAAVLNHHNNSHFNRYHVAVPYTGIIGLNFSEAYHQNALHIDSIVLRSPDVISEINSISVKKEKIEVDTTVQNRLITMILEVFNRVELDRFNLQNASFNVKDKRGDQGQLSQVNLEFFTYVIDSNDLKNKQYLPQIEGLNLSITKPKFTLPSKNRLKAHYLDFSTFTQNLTIDSVLLQGGELDPTQQTSVLVDKLLFTGVDLEEILQYNRINLKELNIVNPKVRVVEQGVKKGNFSIESLLGNRIKEYAVNRVHIKNGQASYAKPISSSSKQRVGQFDVILTHFKLNEQTLKKGKFLYSDNVQATLRNSLFFMDNIQHQLAFSTVRVNTKRRYLEAKNTKIKPAITDSSSIKILANGNLEKLQIQGINFNNLSNLNQLKLTKLIVNNADLSVNKYSSDTIKSDSNNANTSKFQGVDLQNVEIDNVNLLFQKNGKSVIKLSDGFVHANAIAVNENDSTWSSFNIQTDSVTYGATRIVAPLSKLNHFLTLESVNRQYDSTITFSGLSIRPTPGKRISDTALKVVAYIPEIFATRSHTFEQRKNDSLLIGEVAVKKPRIKLQLPVKDNSSAKAGLKSHFTSAILGQFNAVNVAQFNIVDGSLELKQKGDSGQVSVSCGKLNVHSSDWTISNTTRWEADKFLWAKGFETQISELTYSIPGFNICHKVDSIQYSFDPNNLSIHGIYFNSVNETYQKNTNKFSAYLPEVNILGLDVYRYLNDSIINIDAIKSKNGIIEASIYPKEKKDKSKFEFPKIFPDHIKGVNQINIGSVNLTEMDAQAIIHYPDFDAPVEMDYFNVKVDSFSAKPGLLANTNKILWSKNIELDVHDVYTTLDKGLSEIGADVVYLSTEKDSIGITYPSFVPTVYRYEYALHKGFQTNVFTINGKDVGISNLNFHRLMYYGEIEGDSITVNRPSIMVLKDKRIPEPAYRFKENIPQLFKDLKVPVSFEKVKVNNMHVKYEEFAKNGRKPGNIVLTHMNIEANNVTNDTAKLQNDSLLNIKMNALLLDTGRIDFDISYDMLSERNDFNMTTTVGSMDATLFNDFVEPVYFAKINSGNVVSMDMGAIGNDSLAGGKMGLYYNELNFSFLEDANNDTKGFSAKLKSTIGNLVVHTENKYHPFKRRQPVYYERNTNKGWINYLIKIELSGVESSAGLNNHKKDLKKANKKLWKEFNKQDRKAKRLRAKQERKSN